VISGRATQGTVVVQRAASGGTTVQLSSSDRSVSVPSAVTVASGSNTVSFPIATTPITNDVIVTITATLSGRSYKATLTVWHVSANSSIYEVSGRAPVRYTSEDATFFATCSGHSLDLRINGFEWRAVFSATLNTALRPTTYEGTMPNFSGRPGISVDGPSVPQCLRSDSSFRYVIDEMDLPPRGPVRKFVARYEVQCRNGSSSLRGEVLLTNPSPSIVVSPGLQGCSQ
jgi:hypothetical protein